MNWMGNVFSWLGKELSALWTKAEPAAADAFKSFVSTFEGEAIAAVTDLESNSTLTGPQKLAQAIAILTPKIVAAGWDATDAAITTLINDAVVSVRAANGVTLVTAPALQPEAASVGNQT